MADEEIFVQQLQADSFIPDFRSKESFTRLSKKGDSGNREFNFNDQLAWKIGELYKAKFPDMVDNTVRVLVRYAAILDLEHRNLAMVAVALYIVIKAYTKKPEGPLDQKTFHAYYEQFKGILREELTKTKAVEGSETSYEVILYNYVEYVVRGIPQFARILKV